NIVRPVRGVGEAVVDTTAGIVGAGAGAAAGLGMLPIVGTGKLFGGFKDVDLGDAYKAVQEGVANELTKYFQPTTEFGQMLMTPPQSTGDLSVKNFLAQIDPRRLITAPGEIGKELIDLPLESMKAPKAVKYPVETVAEFAAYPAAFKGAKSVKNIVREVLKEKGIELGTRKPVAPTRQELARGIRKLDNIEVSERAGEVAKEKLGQMKEKPYEGPLPMLEAKEAAVTPKTEVIESDRIFNMLEQVREDLPTWEIDKVTDLANKPAAMRTIEENLYLREFEKKYRDVAEPKAEEGAVEKPEYIGPREEPAVVPEKSKIDPMTGKEKPASDFPLEEGVDALRGRLRKQEEPVGSTEELRDTYGRLIKKEGKTAPSDTLELSRIGEFGEEGAYFGVKGQTQYEGGTNYTLSKAKIADVTDKDVAISLIDETLKNKDLTEEQVSSLNEAKQNNGFIDYSLFDETPMAAAAKKLGYDAVKVFENQDFPGVPSSVFVVNTKKLSKAKASEQRLYPAVQIDGKVYVAELPDGTNHGMVWDSIPEGTIASSKGRPVSGWAQKDGSGFTRTPKLTLGKEAEARAKIAGEPVETPKAKRQYMPSGEAGAILTAPRTPFYSKLEEVANFKMKGKMPIEQLRKTMRNNGVTDAEINTVLGDLSGTVTKQQVLDAIAERGTKFEDVVLGDIHEGKYGEQEHHIPQFSQYTEPGAVPGSYREMFVTAPKIKREYNFAVAKQPYKEVLPTEWKDGHDAYSDIQNPIVRIRFNERNQNGKRILFVEEIQGPSEANQAKMPESLQKRIYDIGVKRVLSYAKENGFDGVAWTTGKMQADRYNLAKYVDHLRYDVSGRLEVYDKQGNLAIKRLGILPKDMSELIGKDVANKIVSQLNTGKQVVRLNNLDLEVGGEGLKRLYDEQIPALFKKYGKESVSETEIPFTDKSIIGRNYLIKIGEETEGISDLVSTGGLKAIEDRFGSEAVKQAIIQRANEGSYTKGVSLNAEQQARLEFLKSGEFEYLGESPNAMSVSSTPITTKTPSSFTLYSDPLGFQAASRALGKVVESAKEGWDEVLQKYPTLEALDAKTRSRIEEIVRGIKEGTLDPERVMREDPKALEIFKELATAEEKKNSFMQRIMPDYMAAIKGIKRGSKSSERIGEALDGKRDVADLTQQEKKAYDFFKKTYDWMIHEYARQAAGSESAYHKILTLVRNKSTRATKVKDLKEADLKEYKNLWQKTKDIKGDKKLSELTSEQRESYDRAAQEARDFLRNDVKKSLNEGEAAAYDILSRKLSEYLPHLFDKVELKEMFEAELSKAKEKLGKATNKGVITRLKNRIAVLEKSLSTMKTGKLVNFRDLPHDIFFRFFEERRGKQGYSYDAIKAFETYLYGIARKIYDEPALRKSYKLYEDVKPELQPYTKELVNHYMGYGEKNRFENFSRMVTTLEWIRTLGFNPRSALVNLTQRLNTTVWVGEKYAAEAQYKMLFDRKWADDLLDKSGLAREIPQVLMEGPVAPSLKGLRTIAGWMFDKVELGNRQHALISGYLKAIKEGKSEADAIKAGIKVAHKTQFRYGKLGTPRWMRHPGGRIALQFISYPIKQAQFLYDLYKKNPLSFMRWMGYTVGGNVTLQELLDTDMSNYLGIGISFGEALKAIQFAAEGDMRGAYRHGKQAVQTGGGILPSGPGPAVSSLIKIGQALPKGRGTEQLIQEITPVMWNRLKQAYKAVKEGGEGEYPIFNEREKKYNLTGRQLIQRTLGPRSAYEYEQEMKVGQAKNLEQERTEIQQEIVKMFVDYKTNGDEEALDKIVDLIDKYGDAVKPSDAAIKNEEARRLLTKEERVKPGRKEVYQIMREGEPII
ncbi:MAG: hypothetical protein WC479_10460, partial [Candidatus Izemoplasmatales bacterium]